MHLSTASYERFYRFLDSLSLYAKGKLSLPEFPGDVYSTNNPILSDQFRNEVNKTLWQCPGLIDDFATENPYGMNAASLSEILSWKLARRKTYILWKHEDGRSLFMGAEGIFSVLDLSRDIQSIIPHTPTIVETTLLPFEEKITYGTAASSLSMRARKVSSSSTDSNA